MMRIWATVACAVLLTACNSQPPVPKNVGTVITHPKSVAPDVPPEIQGLVFRNGLEMHLGSTDHLAAAIYTTSNVASVELRTNLFSINATKTGVGVFKADTAVYDLPSIFIRPYTLRIIARNTKGDETEEDVPFRIR